MRADPSALPLTRNKYSKGYIMDRMYTINIGEKEEEVEEEKYNAVENLMRALIMVFMSITTYKNPKFREVRQGVGDTMSNLI